LHFEHQLGVEHIRLGQRTPEQRQLISRLGELEPFPQLSARLIERIRLGRRWWLRERRQIEG
jgi:hypothetical protein